MEAFFRKFYELRWDDIARIHWTKRKGTRLENEEGKEDYESYDYFIGYIYCCPGSNLY